MRKAGGKGTSRLPFLAYLTVCSKGHLLQTHKAWVRYDLKHYQSHKRKDIRGKKKERAQEQERERSSQICWRVDSGAARMLSFGPAFRGRKGSVELHHELKPSRENKEGIRSGGKFTGIVPDQMYPLVTVKSKSKSSLQGNSPPPI